MSAIKFDAKLWKNGNSLLLTIPKNIREGYNLDENDVLKIQASITTKEEIEIEKELNRLRSSYPESSEGAIIHKDEGVAILNEVRFKIMESRGSFVGDNMAFDELPLRKGLVGVILSGKFLSKASTDKHYGKQNLNASWFKRNLSTTEIMKLKTDDGQEILIKDIRFDEDVIKDNNLGFIDMIKFHGRNISITPKTKV